MSRSHCCVIALNFPDFAQNLEICMCILKLVHFNHFYSFVFHVSHILFDFCINLSLFLVQNLLTKNVDCTKKKSYFRMSA